MKNIKIPAILLMMCFLTAHVPAAGKVRLPALIGNGMVLQQNSEATLWGRADPGKKITVKTSWGKEKYTATAAADSTWEVKVRTIAAGGPHRIAISDGETLVLDDIMLGLSVCRNPGLANVFYRLELIEAYGTGMGKIMRSYGYSSRQPLIRTTENAFKIILPNQNAKMSPVSVLRETPGDSQENIVLELVRQNGFVKRKEVEKALELNQTAAGRLLKQMVQKGLLVPSGQGKNTRYILPRIS